MVTASLAALDFFLPILAFLLVFLVSYIFVKKVGIFGDSLFVPIFLSFIFAVFFIINTSLVEFIQISVGWIAFFIVLVFFMMVLFGMLGKDKAFSWVGNKWFGAFLVALVIVFFVIVSSYVFNWVVNWDAIYNWFYTDWFGLALLLIIAAVVSWVLAKGK